MFRVCTFAIAIAASISACSLLENKSRFDPVAMKDVADAPAVQVAHMDWQWKAGNRLPLGLQTVRDGDQWVLATSTGQLYRLDAHSGQVQWSSTLAHNVTGGVAVGQGVVAFVTANAQLHIVDAQNGQPVWQATLSALSTQSPIIDQGRVFVRSQDARVHAFDLKTGKMLWQFLRVPPSLSLSAPSAFVVQDQRLWVGVPQGRLIALDVTNGRVLESYVAVATAGPTEVDSVTDIINPILLGKQDRCFGSYQGVIGCYTTQQQTPRWQLPLSSRWGVGGNHELVIGTGIDGTVLALDRRSGQVRWRHQALKNRGLSNPVVQGDHVWVVDYEGYVHGYRLADGQWQHTLDTGLRSPVSAPVQATAQGLLITFANGHIVSLLTP